MPQSIIEGLLKQRIGLDPNSIGSGAIARAIYQRMVDCELSTMASYLGFLQESPQEWEAFVETIIVPETWFFRETESFDFLKNYILSKWLPNYSNRALRILSVPCSTGEEPYSIAIALLETGLTPNKFCIDAVDISKQCLITAKQAIYNQYSFRSSNLSFQAQYFQSTAVGYQLCEQVRHTVNFIQSNLVSPDFLNNIAPYDIIFCRNLLIYFDRVTKERTLQMLEKLLTQEGLLFVGYAEAGLLLNTGLIPIQYPMTFAYRKATLNDRLLESNSDRDVCKKSCVSQPVIPKPPVRANLLNYSPYKDFFQISKISSSIHTYKDSASGMELKSQVNLLETARDLANEGHLDNATELCKEYLNQNPISAEAYVLLGQIQQAMGLNEQAIQFFRKAIYLQPSHQEALTHLALLRESQGDTDSAALIWQRIRRIHKTM